MAVVVLGVCRHGVSLVVVVMVVTVGITNMPSTTVTVGVLRGIVVSMVGIARRWSREGGSITVLN